MIVRNAVQAIEFYQAVFGAKVLARLDYPGTAKVAHAELLIRNHVLMLGDENAEIGAAAPPANGGYPPASIRIYVPDVDAVYQRAMERGARSLSAPAEMFWGDRYAKFVDPDGHLWSVATHVRDVTMEECEAAMKAWAQQSKAATAAA